MDDITALHRTIAPSASSQLSPCASGAAAAAARERQLQMAKRTAFIVALLAFSAGLIALCVRFGPEALAFVSDTERFRAWVEGMGIWGRVAFVAANAAQVVLAFLPGEPLELAAGYAFGTVEGTLWCLAASAIGTGLALLLTRTFGMRVVRLFFPPEKISEVKWLRDARRFELILFLVFLIPGTPKDLLTYVAGLGTSPAWRIVALTTVGRIPSIVSSTLVAGALGSGNYTAAAIVAAITVALAGAGVLVYRRMSRIESQ
ncbi:TVP38/TMEM64 family protein [Paraeggerthella hongkongensis]|uniref:TVP38/TMEM64 family membrane protein n=1 Tax=Paraeggerthella hongkongensis TaxID=230658 RepID=A0A3N0AYP5_9ACTN|nr:VTT domain-containing protein [Paraeggerthella hongkongensis]RNL39476.1 TVP38/TMEM64 family protein [Paraeggerthella hongkongensis]